MCFRRFIFSSSTLYQTLPRMSQYDKNVSSFMYLKIRVRRTNVPVNEFLDILDAKYEPLAPYSFRARNFQSYEMGLDEQMEDLDEIRRSLIELLDMFGVIIITERFLESLVILAAVFHAPVEYLYAVSTNISKKYAKPNLNEEQMRVFEKFNRIDIMMYELANQKLDKQIDAFGRDRMKTEVDKLEKLKLECSKDKMLCHRKHHVIWSDDPRREQLREELEWRPSEEPNHQPLNRTVVWSKIQHGGGGCEHDRGIHKNLLDKSLSWPKCINTTLYAEWFGDIV